MVLEPFLGVQALTLVVSLISTPFLIQVLVFLLRYSHLK